MTPTKRLKIEWKNILFNLIFALVALLIVIFFYKNILLTTILLIILSIVGLLKWKSRETIILFVFVGLFGATAEMVGIHFGAWEYTLSTVGSVPLWLFILWGDAAAFIYQTGIEIKKLGARK